MKVAIIGSNGGMGSFFVKYFMSKGNRVVGFDIRKGKTETPGNIVASSLKEAVEDADAVMIATPIDSTIKVCKKAASLMKKGSCLIEISSIKGNVLSPLRRFTSDRKIKLLSVHPLFGPTQELGKRMKMIVISTKRKMDDIAYSLFPDMELYEMDMFAHDRMMGIMLALTHATNVAFASVVSRYTDPHQYKRMATPLSYLQITLAQAVLSQNARLMAGIQTQNRYSEQIIRSMINELANIADFIHKNKVQELERFFQVESNALGSKEALRSVYKALDYIAS